MRVKAARASYSAPPCWSSDPPSLPRWNHPARHPTVIDEQNPLRLKRVTQGFDAGRQNGLADFETNDCAGADAGRDSEILL